MLLPAVMLLTTPGRRTSVSLLGDQVLFYREGWIEGVEERIGGTELAAAG